MNMIYNGNELDNKQRNEQRRYKWKTSEVAR